MNNTKEAVNTAESKCANIRSDISKLLEKMDFEQLWFIYLVCRG